MAEERLRRHAKFSPAANRVEQDRATTPPKAATILQGKLMAVNKFINRAVMYPSAKQPATDFINFEPAHQYAARRMDEPTTIFLART